MAGMGLVEAWIDSALGVGNRVTGLSRTKEPDSEGALTLPWAEVLMGALTRLALAQPGESSQSQGQSQGQSPAEDAPQPSLTTPKMSEPEGPPSPVRADSHGSTSYTGPAFVYPASPVIDVVQAPGPAEQVQVLKPAEREDAPAHPVPFPMLKQVPGGILAPILKSARGKRDVVTDKSEVKGQEPLGEGNSGHWLTSPPTLTISASPISMERPVAETGNVALRGPTVDHKQTGLTAMPLWKGGIPFSELPGLEQVWVSATRVNKAGEGFNKGLRRAFKNEKAVNSSRVADVREAVGKSARAELPRSGEPVMVTMDRSPDDPAIFSVVKAAQASGAVPVAERVPVEEATSLTGKEVTDRKGVVDQIVQEARIFIRSGHANPGALERETSEMVVQLKPEFLGRIRMKVVAHEDQLVARVETESIVTKRLLEGGLPQLRQSLVDAGIKVDGLSISIAQGFVGRELKWGPPVAGGSASVSRREARLKEPRRNEELALQGVGLFESVPGGMVDYWA